MVERRIDEEDTNAETVVLAIPVKATEADTVIMRRPPPKAAAATPYRGPTRTQQLPPEPIEGTPTVPPMSIPRVDARARPVESAGFEQRYEERSVLGVGGMGEVRLCRDRLVGRDVALKVMNAGPAATSDARDRFVREARIQGQLEHPAVVPVYDIGIDPQGGVFFTMKRIRGMTLHSIFDALTAREPGATAKFSRRKLLTAFGSICLAVDFAHRRGVIHRDIKPANIILGDFGEVYVIDWGLAKAMGTARSPDADALELTEDGSSSTMLGSMIGTPGYMSPEQAHGDVDRLDARTDVYALGAILFEILAGEPLHNSLSLDAMIRSTILGADARPSKRARPDGSVDVPPELDAVCVRATQIDPANRYRSARALSDAVESFLDGDRNVELRQNLAKNHLAAAREAMDRALHGGSDDDGVDSAMAARALALREVGSALALEPSNADALRMMARLLMDVPDKVPLEAEGELKSAADASRKDAARVGANRYIAWSAFLPLGLWMGVHHLPSTVAAVVGIVLCGLTSWWISRRTRVGLRQGFALLLLSSGAIGLMSALFGPFILIPGLVATNTMFFAMNADRQARLLVIAMGVITISLPFFLELSGVLPNAYQFEGGKLLVLPRASELPALQTMVCLFLTSIAIVIIPGLLMGRMRDALTAAERRLFLQAWHLRQLVPSGAQEALTKNQEGAK